jgi:hypothetical protein
MVTVEERMRGWLAVIAKEKTAYRELARLFEFYQEFEILPFDHRTARKFDELRSQRLRIGTMDLKDGRDGSGSRCTPPVGQPVRFPAGSQSARRRLAGLTRGMRRNGLQPDDHRSEGLFR